MHLRAFQLVFSNNSRRFKVILRRSGFRKTIAYAKVKEAYFAALREAVPELTNIATARERGLPSWTGSPRLTRSLAKSRNRRRTQQRWFCYKDSRAIRTSRRRGRNSRGQSSGGEIPS